MVDRIVKEVNPFRSTGRFSLGTVTSDHLQRGKGLRRARVDEAISPAPSTLIRTTRGSNTCAHVLAGDDQLAVDN
jgi:hypothetical protein